MPHWKQIFLYLYYIATGPLRAWDRRRDRRRGSAPLIVLCWHRVADDRATEWTIRNDVFREQIEWLKSRFRFISLAEVQQRMAAGFNQEPCLSVTFDDGYADNCQAAIPLLLQEKIPCTYFVTVENILHSRPFEHDLAAGKELAPNSLSELRAMAASGVEIGAHGYRHVNLGALVKPLELRREVAEAQEKLAAALGRSVHYFAFPYGQYENLSPLAFAIAKEAGYLGVCSAYGGFNLPGENPFHVQRIMVDESLIRLKNCVTLDRRKRRTPRVDFLLAETPVMPAIEISSLNVCKSFPPTT